MALATHRGKCVALLCESVSCWLAVTNITCDPRTPFWRFPCAERLGILQPDCTTLCRDAATNLHANEVRATFQSVSPCCCSGVWLSHTNWLDGNREFSDLLGGSTYLPHIPYSLVDGVYAAQFGTDEATLLMVVNRNGDPAGDRSGDILRVPCVSGARWFDVYHGHEMTVACADGFAVLRFRIEALGYGAVLRCTNTAPTCIPTTGYMERMRELTRSELRTFTDRWQHLPQTMAPSSATPVPAGGAPAGMVMLPGGDLEFDASYGGRPSPGVPFSGDVQFPWEPSPRTNHRQLLAMHPLYMDIHPVTNQQYAEYLSASGYNPPVSSQNWLRHWPAGPSGGPPPDWENKPVTWVSRDDASAYCQYFNKRLPHTWEYQWAAQGQLEDESIYFPPSYDGAMMNHSLVSNLNRTRPNRRRLDEAPPPPPAGEFPWCRIGLPCEDDPTRYPPRSNNGVQPPPEDVGGYPSGASAFGVQDLMYSVSRILDCRGSHFLHAATRLLIHSQIAPPLTFWIHACIHFVGCLDKCNAVFDE